MSQQPLKLAVVGHTNTGKTSLLRTLLHDSQFGEVDSRPSTTRDVIRIEIAIAENPIIQLFDTPGLEAGTELYENLEGLATDYRHDGPGQISAFLKTAPAAHEFEQEAKVLRLLLDCHAALYVIDVRDPVLPKFQDELSVLARCGKPILPVLNFTASAENQMDAWRQALTKVNLHAFVEFDAASPPIAGEEILFSRLAAITPQFQVPLQQLSDYRHEQRKNRAYKACQQIAELLIDVAGVELVIAGNTDQDQIKQSTNALQNRVRKREQSCVDEVLALYAFQLTDTQSTELQVTQAFRQDDLFDAASLKQFGLKAGLGVGSGAAIGAGFDLMVGGLSLGAGTTLGALAGGIWQGWNQYGRKVLGRWRGQIEIVVDEAILQLVTLRQLDLLTQLNYRGHGAQTTIHISVPSKGREKFLIDLLANLKRVRNQSNWSSLNIHSYIVDTQRNHCRDSIARQLNAYWLNNMRD